jgi:hypothetical protein
MPDRGGGSRPPRPIRDPTTSRFPGFPVWHGICSRLLGKMGPGSGGVLGKPTEGRVERPRAKRMTTMDFWYDLASRGPADLNQEATHLLREAEDRLRLPASEHADDDDE